MVDLDHASRLDAFRGQQRLGLHKFEEDLGVKLPGMLNFIPALVLFDFARAFPSVAHEWLFLVLKAIDILKGLLNLISGMYDCNEVPGESDSGYTWPSIVLSGVPQGCPLSGFLVLCRSFALILVYSFSELT